MLFILQVFVGKLRKDFWECLKQQQSGECQHKFRKSSSSTRMSYLGYLCFLGFSYQSLPSPSDLSRWDSTSNLSLLVHDLLQITLLRLHIVSQIPLKPFVPHLN
jgi:hypothetical protein